VHGNSSNTNVVVIVPCFNEGKIVRKILTELLVKGYSVIAIDDGSNDNTFSEMSKTAAKLLQHRINLGQGAALETGLEYVRRHVKNFDYLCTFDADGQHNVDDIEVLVNSMVQTKYNVILGNRFGQNQFEGGKVKGFLLRFSARLTKFTIGLNVADRHNGLRCLDRKSVNSIKLNIAGYGHADDFLRQIVRNDLTYGEAPVRIRYTSYSKSKGQPLYNLITILFDRAMLRK